MNFAQYTNIFSRDVQERPKLLHQHLTLVKMVWTFNKIFQECLWYIKYYLVEFLFASDVMEVKQIPRRQMFWKLANKPEAIELVPSSYAVVHLDNLNNHRNVLALIQLSQNSQITSVKFFTSENTQVVCNIRDFLSKCCDGKNLKHTSLVRFINFSNVYNNVEVHKALL